MSVPFTQLGTGSTPTLKKFLFATPTVALTVPFFAGYTINYNFNVLNGDTIGLKCTKNGERTLPLYVIDTVISGIDTLIDTTVNVQNATLFADNIWYDNYTQNDSLYNDLAIYPIVVSHNPTGIKGIIKNNFTFYGNYPNPATAYTNIRFALAATESVIIQVIDNVGQVINIINQPNLSKGEHIITLNTNQYPGGDYFYIISTTNSNGFAGKISVVK